jgi:hypothetical protein
MIVYDLQCSAGHRFEGWFDDKDAYESQKKGNLIACPVCEDVNISRLPSAFAIKSAPDSPKSADAPVDMEVLRRSVNEYFDKNFDDVGCNFATEALKIHYGVSEKKNIRGTSTKEEEKLLEKEGIPFFKVPIPSDADSNSNN